MTNIEAITIGMQLDWSYLDDDIRVEP